MTKGTLLIDWWAILGLILLFLSFLGLRYWTRKRETTRVFFSKLSDFRGRQPSLRLRLAPLPTYLHYAAIFFFACAFLDPHLRVQEEQQADLDFPNQENEEGGLEEVALPTEGIALYLVLDQSGSMGQPLQIQTKAGNLRKMRRIDFLKEVTSQFVKGNTQVGLGGRPNDMIGLLAFARVPEILTPLTLDHDEVLDKLSALDIVPSRERDGTGIGYAIYKTAHLIAASRHFAEELVEEGKPSYEIKSQVMIVVTDGLQNTHPLDSGHQRRTVGVSQAADLASQEGIRVYIINIEPQIRQARFRQDLNVLQEAAKHTGGHFFIADDATSLMEIYAEIDTLEKTLLPQAKTGLATIINEWVAQEDTPYFKRISFYPYLIACGLFCLALSLLLSSTYLRRAL